MHKIKKFKISLRPASVRKNFKVLAGPERLTQEAEEIISREYGRAHAWTSSAAVYHTFRRDQWPTFISIPQDSAEPAAVTLCAATIGTDVENEIERAGAPDGLQALTLAALAEEAAEATMGFIYRLLSEEAKKEDCELGDRLDLPSPDSLTAALATLEADKIGVSLKGPGGFSPRFTRVSSILWIPRMTKKRRLLLAKPAS